MCWRAQGGGDYHFRLSTASKQELNVLYQALAKSHRNGIPNLVSSSHEPAEENIVVGKRLDASRLAHRYPVIEYRVNKPAFGRIDTGRGHRRCGLARVNSTVDVVVTVMIDMTIEQSTGVLSAASVRRGTSERGNQVWAMVHMNAVEIIHRQIRECLLAWHPWLQASGFGQFGGRMRALRRPLETFCRDVLSNPQDEHSLAPLRDTIVTGIQLLWFIENIPAFERLAIELVEVALVTGPQHARDVLHKECFGLEPAYEREVIMNQSISRIIHSSIIDPMSGESLTRRPPEKEIAVSIGKVLLSKGSSTQRSNVVVIDYNLLAPILGSNVVFVSRGGALVELHGENNLTARLHCSE